MRMFVLLEVSDVEISDLDLFRCGACAVGRCRLGMCGFGSVYVFGRFQCGGLCCWRFSMWRLEILICFDAGSVPLDVSDCRCVVLVRLMNLQGFDAEVCGFEGLRCGDLRS